jgi:uncharacterized membrane protein YidH (DUF202 family)
LGIADGTRVFSVRPSPDSSLERFESMTLMHITLGALSSIFGAHLSWAVTDLIIKRRHEGRSVVLPTLLSVAGVIVIVVTCGVVLSSTTV